ncbi:MAG: hypothetical protein ACT4PI_10595 [Actinomycetota bacterium]
MLLAIGIVALVGIGVAVAVVASGDDGSDDTAIDTGDDTGSVAEPVDEAVTGPCTGELDVLAAADIEAAVGLPVSDGLTEGGSCDFAVGDSTLSVTIERSDDPAAAIESDRSTTADVEDVPGVGDEAIYEPGLDVLYARSGDILVRFFYSGTDEAFTVDTFTLLAQTVFQRTGVA